MPEADNWEGETERQRGERDGGGEMGDERERRVLNTICGVFDAMSSCGNGRREEGREDGRQVKKCPCPCCLFQQRRLTNCPRTNRDKRREGEITKAKSN